MTTPADSLHRVEGLLERLKAATRPDRELDAAICLAAGYADMINPRNLTYVRIPESEPMFTPAPPLTASIDAALALVERVLPGWGFSISGFTYTKTKTAMLWTEGKPEHTGLAPTAPLAVLCALLSALTSRSQDQ